MMAPRIDPEMGILELPGNAPSWIWAFTCPTPDCPCRSALVLATSDGRETLLARGAPVSQAWLRGDSYAAAAASLSDLTVFGLDVDAAEVNPLGGETRFTPDDLAARPELRRVVEGIDGEILDEIGRLWYLGKGMRSPEEAKREAPRIEIDNWVAGELVSWNEVMLGVRDDLYIIDDGVFEAMELYCVTRGCACGEVLVDFSESKLPDARHLGGVHLGAVHLSGRGEVVLDPASERERQQLERLWAAFQLRHPRHRERFTRRAAVMQELGGKIVPVSRGRARNLQVAAPTKVGRNEPCPCGSGKKYKKCCGAA